MKRIYFLLLVLFSFVAGSAQAQLRWGVKGGVNVASIHFTDLPSSLKTDNITGFHIGPTMEWMVPLAGFGIDASLLYTQMGTKVSSTSVKSNYLDVPVNLKLKFGIPTAKIYAAAGPFIGFRLGGDKIWNVISDQIESKSFSAGLNIGAGVELLQRLQIGANYHLGLTDNYSISAIGSDGKNRSWQISAAILF